MKSRGALNWRHNFAFLETHLDDAQKQRLQKKGRDADRLRRKLRKVAREFAAEGRDLRNEAEEARKRKDREARSSSSIESLRFPALEYGFSSIRANLGSPAWQNDKPPPGAYEVHGWKGTERLAEWINEVGGWHAGYQTGKSGPGADEIQFFKTPNSKQPGVKKDRRFVYSTHHLPQWDTQALQDALAAGEISPADMKAIFSAHDRWCETEGARLASCGAARELVYTGSDCHLEDGSVHTHPRFLKSTPLAYERADGELHPKALAPRGRHRADERWVGGKRLGLLNANGQVVTNPLGPALCAADAWREEKLKPPVDYGDTWGFLERAIARRTQGGYWKFKDRKDKESEPVWVPDKGVTKGPDGKGLKTLPEDLEGCRHLRSLVKELAQRVPAFRIRRDDELAKARAAAEAEHGILVKLLAGDELAQRDAAIDTANGVVAQQKSELAAKEQQLQAERETTRQSKQSEREKAEALKFALQKAELQRLQELPRKKFEAFTVAVSILGAGGTLTPPLPKSWTQRSDGKFVFWGLREGLLGTAPPPERKAQVDALWKKYSEYLAAPPPEKAVPISESKKTAARLAAIEKELAAEKAKRAVVLEKQLRAQDQALVARARRLAKSELETLTAACKHIRDVQTGSSEPSPGLFGNLLEVSDVPGGLAFSDAYAERFHEVSQVLGEGPTSSLVESLEWASRVANCDDTTFSKAKAACEAPRTGRHHDHSAESFGDDGQLRPEILEAAKASIQDAKRNGSAALRARARIAQELLSAVDAYRTDEQFKVVGGGIQGHQKTIEESGTKERTATAKLHEDRPSPAVTPLPEITAALLVRVVDLQQRLLRCKRPSPGDLPFIQPVIGRAAAYVIREDLLQRILKFRDNDVLGTKCREIVQMQQQLLVPVQDRVLPADGPQLPRVNLLALTEACRHVREAQAGRVEANPGIFGELLSVADVPGGVAFTAAFEARIEEAGSARDGEEAFMKLAREIARAKRVYSFGEKDFAGALQACQAQSRGQRMEASAEVWFTNVGRVRAELVEAAEATVRDARSRIGSTNGKRTEAAQELLAEVAVYQDRIQSQEISGTGVTNPGTLIEESGQRTKMGTDKVKLAAAVVKPMPAVNKALVAQSAPAQSKESALVPAEALGVPSTALGSLGNALVALRLRHQGKKLSAEQERFLRVEDTVAGSRLLSTENELLLERWRSHPAFREVVSEIDQGIHVAKAAGLLFDAYRAVLAHLKGVAPNQKEQLTLDSEGRPQAEIVEAAAITLQEFETTPEAMRTEGLSDRAACAELLEQAIETMRHDHPNRELR